MFLQLTIWFWWHIIMTQLEKTICFGFGWFNLFWVLLCFKQKLHVLLVLVVPVLCIASCEHILIIYVRCHDVQCLAWTSLWTYSHNLCKMMFCVSGIALLEQFCEEGIHLQNPTEDPNHQVTLAQKHGNPNKIKSQWY